MNWLPKFLRRNRETIPDKVSRGGLFLPRRSLSGVRVDEDVALTYTAVWSAVRVISETIASLSWHVYSNRPGGGKMVDEDHPVDWLLHNQPNPEMTPCTFRETLQQHVLLWGNGYAEIERDRSGRPVWLWPLPPDRVTPKRAEDGQVIYEVRTGQSAATVKLPARDMFHVKGLGFDGLVGYSVISMAKEAIGMGIAAERFGAAFYGNDTRPGGVLSHPAQLSPTARDNLKQEWSDIYQGPQNSWKVALLEEGVSFNPIGIPQNDAQYIETRKFQVTEVARLFRLPPSKLADLERSTFSNIEHQNIQFVTDSILPWVCKWEQEANWKLFGRNTQGNRFTKLNLDTLLRGDLKTRYEAYAIGRQWGWLTPNAVLALEDQNPLDSDQNGDVALVPSNMIASEKVLDDPEPPPQFGQQPEPAEDDEQESDDDAIPTRSIESFTASYVKVFEDILTRCISRERQRLSAMNGKSSDDFFGEHRSYMTRSLEAASLTMGDIIGQGPSSITASTVKRSLDGFVDEYVRSSSLEFAQAQATGSVKELMDLWSIDRPASVSELLANKLSRDVRKQSNVKQIA